MQDLNVFGILLSFSFKTLISTDFDYFWFLFDAFVDCPYQSISDPNPPQMHHDEAEWDPQCGFSIELYTLASTNQSFGDGVYNILYRP